MIMSMLTPHLLSIGANVNQVGMVFLIEAGTHILGTCIAGAVSGHLTFDSYFTLNCVYYILNLYNFAVVMF